MASPSANINATIQIRGQDYLRNHPNGSWNEKAKGINPEERHLSWWTQMKDCRKHKFGFTVCKKRLDESKKSLAYALAGEKAWTTEPNDPCCALDEASLHIKKARLKDTNLRHLWRRRHIRLPIKGRAYATVQSVLSMARKHDHWGQKQEEFRCFNIVASVALAEYDRGIFSVTQRLGLGH